jgi:crotonobetainyl-CoA:carnitine CoA-transferase CaiB-like acyl-CoA transferase
MEPPLAGVRVLDFGMAAVGPVSVSYLGYLGADVIKIESPAGDIVRKPWVITMNGMGTTFIGNNTNKRSIVIDLKDDQDRAIAIELVKTADVVLDNFRSPDVMKGLGLGYDVMRTANPQIIYLQSSAYGNRGPMKGMVSHDPVTQAAGGYASMNGAVGAPPELSRASARLDWSAAMINCAGMLGALYLRRRTGRGMMLETNQFTSTITAGLSRFSEYLQTGDVPGPFGSARPNVTPDEVFVTASGFLSITAPNDRVWSRLCGALGLNGLVEDLRFRTNAARVEHRAELVELLETVLSSKAAWQWENLLKAHNVPCSQYFQDRPTSHMLMEHPQVLAHEMAKRIETPWGASNVCNAHWTFSKNCTVLERPAPLLDEHREQILAELPRRTPRTVPGSEPQVEGVLAGLTVIDVSQGLSGPMCSMILADLGADVVKVEPPEGDWLREVGPMVDGESALFVRLNRGKKGVTLDLKDPADKQAFTDLVATADVLVEGYRTGVMDALGLGYDDLETIAPGLVYCSISGNGSKGPMASLPATELDIQAAVGSWRRLGVRTQAPLRVGFDIMSTVAAWAGVQATLAALYVRQEHGEGQHVETSLMHVGVALQSQNFAAESNPDRWAKESLAGYVRPPEHGFRCADAYFLLDISREAEQWALFCQMIGADAILEDPLFLDFDLRQDNGHLLVAAMAPYLASWQFAELNELVRGLGGTIVRISDAATLMADPQVDALGLVRELHHPVLGTYRTTNVPWESTEPFARLAPAPAPSLGEHNEEILHKSAGVPTPV